MTVTLKTLGGDGPWCSYSKWPVPWGQLSLLGTGGLGGSLGTMTQAPLPSTELALRRGPVLRMWLLAPAVALQAHTMKANSSL